MSEAVVDLAEGTLTAITIDFDHPDWCEFRLAGHDRRFRVPRRMIRRVNSSSVVVVAYRQGSPEPAPVDAMIVHRCGRPGTPRDREALTRAVARRSPAWRSPAPA